MFVRDRQSVEAVDWGNGTSHRLLVQRDGLGFGVAHTVVNAGSESRLQYTRHTEACYCISGSGEVASADGSVVHRINPGIIYVLDQHDAHFLRADPDADMHLISIFDPPILGTERHRLSSSGFSQY
jgi:L-ectoine synthase